METPLHLLIASIRAHYVLDAAPSIRAMLDYMIVEDKESTMEIMRDICSRAKNMTLFYMFSKEYGLSLQLENKNWFSWVLYGDVKKQIWYLFENGIIDPRKTLMDSQTILHVYCYGDVNGFALKCMIMFGDVNQQDDFGNTPLHLATKPYVAKTLRKYGADPNIENSMGVKAIHNFKTPGANYKTRGVEKLTMCKGCLRMFTSHTNFVRHSLQCKKTCDSFCL